MAQIKVKVIILEKRKTKNSNLYKALYQNSDKEQEIVEFFSKENLELNKQYEVPFYFGRINFYKGK